VTSQLHPEGDEHILVPQNPSVRLVTLGEAVYVTQLPKRKAVHKIVRIQKRH